ncbi:hypothetical protein FOA52_012843 [Chlamydomonas sp. UWO 241]|nr:hypothetical protein FOA52_012843 [Chlamydomonas sp. UWO 241]
MEDSRRRVQLVDFRSEVSRALERYPVVVGTAEVGQADAGVARTNEERQADGGNAVTEQEGQAAGVMVEVEPPYTGIWDEHGRPKLPVESFSGDEGRKLGRSRVATWPQRLVVIEHGAAYAISKWWSKVKESKVSAPEVWTQIVDSRMRQDSRDPILFQRESLEKAASFGGTNHEAQETLWKWLYLQAAVVMAELVHLLVAVVAEVAAEVVAVRGVAELTAALRPLLPQVAMVVAELVHLVAVAAVAAEVV